MHARTQNIVAVQDLIEAFEQVGLSVERPSKDGSDLVVRAASRTLLVDCKTASAPTAAAVDHMIAGTSDARQRGHAHVLVADRLTEAARARLRDAGWGWVDRRGHVRLWAPHAGLFIDTATEPLRLSTEGAYSEPLSTRVGLEVAIAVLRNHAARASVRALAHEIERAPSAVSTVLARLREMALLAEDNRPLIPDLFDEVSNYWRPRRVALARAPMPGQAEALKRLQLNLHDVRTPGWALTDTLAASYYGAPIVVGGAYPPDFYVPSGIVLRDAVNYFGPATSYEDRACTVCVPPIAGAVADRVDRPEAEFLLAPSLFVALELARDRTRGREVLDGWRPPERVW